MESVREWGNGGSEKMFDCKSIKLHMHIDKPNFQQTEKIFSQFNWYAYNHLSQICLEKCRNLQTNIISYSWLLGLMHHLKSYMKRVFTRWLRTSGYIGIGLATGLRWFFSIMQCYCSVVFKCVSCNLLNLRGIR